MCSIIGSFKKDVLLTIAEKNSKRGPFACSLSIYNQSYGIVHLERKYGEFFEENDIKSDKLINDYYIGHLQAPTGGLVKTKNFSRVHPSVYIREDGSKTYLYHNGMLKRDYINQLKQELGVNIHWDTRLLHLKIEKDGLESLSEVDGSFGCVYICDDKFYIFTCEIITLFRDQFMNLSSTKINKYYERIEPGKVFQFIIDPVGINWQLVETDIEFKSKSNPYYIPSETNEHQSEDREDSESPNESE